MKIVDADKVSLCPDCGNPIKCDEPIACLNQFHEQEPEYIVKTPEQRRFLESLLEVQDNLMGKWAFR